MKPRARRIAFQTVVAGCLVVAGLVVFNWPTVRDHAEAWWFQLTMDTATIPLNYKTSPTDDHQLFLFSEVARIDGCPVIFDPAEKRGTAKLYRYARIPRGPASFRFRWYVEECGYRIIEQRFPRRAYVILGSRSDEQAEQIKAKSMGREF